MLKIKKETVSMYTRDGVRLDANIYRPDSKESFPVILMRQPYGKEIASTVVYAHPQWYAQQGYIVVIQDVRGRGTSEGEFSLFAREINDGLDTVNWASQLSGSTGKVGMYGFSYQGMTQLYAAISKPEALKVICPAMLAYDLYHDWAYENNAFCLELNLAWAIQLATETARRKQDEIAYQKLYRAGKNLPLFDLIPAWPDVLQELAPDSFYHSWLSLPETDEYWQKLSPKYLLKDVDLPMLHIGGWFDPYLRGTLNLYNYMNSFSQFPQHLIVGPWAHLPWGHRLGIKDYGEEAISAIDLVQVAWFDKFLKEIDSSLCQQPAVCLFEMGSNCWRYFDHFCSGKEGNYYLQSNGLNSIRKQGKLAAKSSDNFVDIFVHDFWRAVPALGSHASLSPGIFERSALHCRSDILTYTSEPLTEDLVILGTTKLEIYAQADRPSFDLNAVLSEVTPAGEVYNFTQGYIKIENSQLPIVIKLQPTYIKIPQGNCLRLSLNGACFPAYPINSGTGKPLQETRLIDNQIITIIINSGIDFPSQIIIPILK